MVMSIKSKIGNTILLQRGVARGDTSLCVFAFYDACDLEP